MSLWADFEENEPLEEGVHMCFSWEREEKLVFRISLTLVELNKKLSKARFQEKEEEKGS
jgi:hypothetical protein